jgi:hypothetical protein
MERIANLWNTICTISHIEGRVVLLQMLGQRLSVLGWLGSL